MSTTLTHMMKIQLRSLQHLEQVMGEDSPFALDSDLNFVMQNALSKLITLKLYLQTTNTLMDSL